MRRKADDGSISSNSM